jgi:hypothetical protein
MDAKTAKRIPLPEFLAALGHKPAAVKGRDVWYLSPFRKEGTASFKVDAGRNLWYDHGEGRGGTIIDLVQALYGDDSVSRVLRTIATVWGGSAPPPERGFPEAEGPAVAAIRTEKVLRLSDTALVRYLEEARAVPLAVASPYVKEIRYRTKEGRGFSAIGFPNRSGGYELRSPSFKGTLGPKDLSVIGGAGGAPVRVFEGFTDFLSAQVLWPEEREIPALVLNSVALAERSARHLAETGTPAVAYFDADAAGDRAMAVLAETLGAAASDARGRLEGHKDLNELLVSRRNERE